MSTSPVVVLPRRRVASSLFLFALGFGLAAGPVLRAGELPEARKGNEPKVSPASDEGERAIKGFKVPAGFKVELFAAEPLLANPVAFSIDENGRFYVVETFRLHAGVGDIRGRRSWADPEVARNYNGSALEDAILDDELASKSVEEDIAMLSKYGPKRAVTLSGETDRLRLIYPGANGRAERATVFADGFDKIGDGLAAGVLARRGKVWFTDIPDLWQLQDTKGSGTADVKKSLHHGYGVRVGFLGHDMHGLKFGPDGKLYFSIGDRGANVKASDGRTIYNPESGAVFRCNPDGSELEIFATGLRNPQELTFDKYGNLWTGDNNSDAGDPARWVYVVEGGDSGWRVGYQFIERPNARGPWLAERLCYPFWDGQAAYIVPPVDIIGNGPSGLAYYPGTGFSDRYNDHFFLVDFRGSAANSGVHSFAVKTRGAGFETTDKSQFIWSILATDFDFGFDGNAYVSDWVEGWNMTGKGRLYRVTDPDKSASADVAQVKKLFSEGFVHRTDAELAALLRHADMRVRQEAQFALAERGSKSIPVFLGVIARKDHQLARIHAVWGLGQVGVKSRSALDAVLPLLDDSDAEVRAQAAKVLGDGRLASSFSPLVRALSDENLRVRYFAAMALGKLGRASAAAPVMALLRENANRDPFLRHAGVFALAALKDRGAVLAAAHDSSAALRLAAVVVLRRWETPDVAQFLSDADPRVVLEAARAVSDASIYRALPRLAGLIAKKLDSEPLGRRVVNANFRLGTPETARALARLAADKSAIENIRIEALQCLGEWARPSGRDRINGLWRPLPPRDVKSAIRAAREFLGDILKDAPERLRSDAARLAGTFALVEFNPDLRNLVVDTGVPASVRVEALQALALNHDSGLAVTLDLAARDKNESVRRTASSLRAKSRPGEAVGQLVEVLEKGTIGEQQNAVIMLANLASSEADRVLSQLLDRLLAGNLKPELKYDLIEGAGKRPASDLAEKLAKYESGRARDNPLSQYRDLLYGGDAASGRKIFVERPEASCIRCHKVKGEGADVGPDLTGVGARQPREYLLESMVWPNAKIAAGFESVILELNSGTRFAGILKSETETELTLNSPEDGLVRVKKADLKLRQKGASGMVEGLSQMLSKRDLRDLVEYLASLK